MTEACMYEKRDSRTAIAGGLISVGGKISKDHTTVELVAGNGIAIGTSISSGATVRLLSGGGQITVPGGISDNGTTVTHFPARRLVENKLLVDPLRFGNRSFVCRGAFP
jgi:hypothetical protein